MFRSLVVSVFLRWLVLSFCWWCGLLCAGQGMDARVQRIRYARVVHGARSGTGCRCVHGRGMGIQARGTYRARWMHGVTRRGGWGWGRRLRSAIPAPLIGFCVAGVPFLRFPSSTGGHLCAWCVGVALVLGLCLGVSVCVFASQGSLRSYGPGALGSRGPLLSPLGVPSGSSRHG